MTTIASELQVDNVAEVQNDYVENLADTAAANYVNVTGVNASKIKVVSKVAIHSKLTFQEEVHVPTLKLSVAESVGEPEENVEVDRSHADRRLVPATAAASHARKPDDTTEVARSNDDLLASARRLAASYDIKILVNSTAKAKGVAVAATNTTNLVNKLAEKNVTVTEIVATPPKLKVEIEVTVTQDVDEEPVEAPTPTQVAQLSTSLGGAVTVSNVETNIVSPSTPLPPTQAPTPVPTPANLTVSTTTIASSTATTVFRTPAPTPAPTPTPTLPTPVACTKAADGNDCLNSGIVTGTTGSCGCNCLAGYSGDNCQMAKICTKAADGNDCLNGGRVIGTTGSCGCSCLQPYDGPNCEILDGAICMRPRTKGYDWSFATEQVAMDNLTVDGMRCAPGFAGIPHASRCLSAGNYYKVTGCEVATLSTVTTRKILPGFANIGLADVTGLSVGMILTISTDVYQESRKIVKVTPNAMGRLLTEGRPLAPGTVGLHSALLYDYPAGVSVTAAPPKTCPPYKWTPKGVAKVTTRGQFTAMGSPQAGKSTSEEQIQLLETAMGFSEKQAIDADLIVCPKSKDTQEVESDQCQSRNTATIFAVIIFMFVM